MCSAWAPATSQPASDCQPTAAAPRTCHRRSCTRALAERRVYLHPVRWTSLGLSLLEAMHLGMPVVALATTEVTRAVPPGTGVVSARPEVLAEAVRHYLRDPGAATADGLRARRAAIEHYGLKRFLADWNRLIEEVCA